MKTDAGKSTWVDGALALNRATRSPGHLDRQSKEPGKRGQRDKVGLLSHSLGTYSSFSLCPQASLLPHPSAIQESILSTADGKNRTLGQSPQLPLQSLKSLGATCSTTSTDPSCQEWCPHMWPGPLPSPLPRGLTWHRLSWWPPHPLCSTGMSAVNIMLQSVLSENVSLEHISLSIKALNFLSLSVFLK